MSNRPEGRPAKNRGTPEQGRPVAAAISELLCNSEQAFDRLTDVVGKAEIEAVALLSAQQVAGPKQAPARPKARLPGTAGKRVSFRFRS